MQLNPLSEAINGSLAVSSSATDLPLPAYSGRGFLSTLNLANDGKLSGQTRSEAIQKALGLVISPASGTYLYTPLGNRIFRQIENVVISEFEGIGALKVSFPVLCSPQPPLASGGKSRLDTFAKGIFRTTGSHHDFMLNPSSEELAAWTIQNLGHLSYRELPKIIYDIGKRFRINEGAKGYNRAHEYSLCETYGFCSTQDEESKLQKLICLAIEGILSNFEISYRSAVTLTTEGNRAINYYVLTPQVDSSSSGQFRITQKSSADENLLLGLNEDIIEVAVKKTALSEQANILKVRAFRVAQVTVCGAGSLDVRFQTAAQCREPVRCVAAGLSLNKLMSALLEVKFSPAGMKWPLTVAPFAIAVVPLGDDPTGKAWSLAMSAWKLCRSLSDSVIFDDRITRAHSKILEHQLLGIPLRIFCGAKAVETGKFQLSYAERVSPELVPIADLNTAIKSMFPD